LGLIGITTVGFASALSLTSRLELSCTSLFSFLVLREFLMPMAGAELSAQSGSHFYLVDLLGLGLGHSRRGLGRAPIGHLENHLRPFHIPFPCQ
jgi:hypothetical protein